MGLDSGYEVFMLRTSPTRDDTDVLFPVSRYVCLLRVVRSTQAASES